MKSKLARICHRILVTCPIVIVLLIMCQVIIINRFNHHSYTYAGGDDKKPTYFAFDSRKDSTSTWLKRDFKWNGSTYDLRAQTIDGVLHNNSSDRINEWSVRIDIKSDCFINNAWCGMVRIHQKSAKGGVKEQLLDLRDYDKSTINLDYTFDGDLLIPLKKGDYVIYYPSAKDDEIPVLKKSELTMGCIFYYFDTEDFMDYNLTFKYHRNLTYGLLYVSIIILAAVWVIGAGLYGISLQIYKDATRQLEFQKSGILCMSDIYEIIFMVDLKKDKIIPVLVSDKGREPDHDIGANAYIKKIFDYDATDAFRELTFEFSDLTTISERLSERNSIVCEYISRNYGWSRIRFFAMDRIEGRPVDKVLFTIQNIDAEKREMDEIEERVMRAESGNIQKGVFLESVSAEILAPVNNILQLNDRILELPEAENESVREYATGVKRSGQILESIIEDLMDYAGLEAGNIKLKSERFPLSRLIDDIKDYAETVTAGQPVEVKTDIARNIPGTIVGDEDNLRKILFNMINSSMDHTREGSITLSVFCREIPEHEGRVHLVFSVRDTGDGTDDGEYRMLGLRLAEGILLKMGSVLNVVNTPGDGAESFFEMEADV